MSFTLPFVMTKRGGEFGTVLTASLADLTGDVGYITGLSLNLGVGTGAKSYLSAGYPAPVGLDGATFAFAKATFDFGRAPIWCRP